MTPTDALKILTEATAGIPGTRQQHAVIAQALQVLGQVLQPKLEIPAQKKEEK